MIKFTRNIGIDENDVDVEFMRSTGPGGQNVNKVSTAVRLTFDVSASSLPQQVKDRLRKLSGNRINKDGELIIEARRFRSQKQNRDDAMERLIKLIRRAARKPKRRKKTRPTAASKRKRLESKRRRSQTKQFRKKVRPEQ